jgi:hypothetical protein
LAAIAQIVFSAAWFFLFKGFGLLYLNSVSVTLKEAFVVTWTNFCFSYAHIESFPEAM